MGKQDEIDEEVKNEENEGGEGGQGGQAGNSQGGNNSGGNSNGSQNGGNSGSNEKTFTQAQVNKMMTAEKNQGRAAALRALGIDPKDKGMMESVKNFISSQKSEEDKNSELEAQLAEQTALVAVMKAGVKPQYADDAVALAMSKANRNGSSIDEAMSEYKQKYPEWFGLEGSDDGDGDGSGNEGDDEKGKKGVGNKKFVGTGTTPPAGGKKQTENKQEGLGKRLAASRKKSTRKSSYWN